MQKGVSVVICTYNGRKLLNETLTHLVKQEFTCPFEIILVDNASTDGTKAYAESWWKENGVKQIAFNTYSQPIPGKAYAQDMGYEKAKYEYLLVCDDDNWLVKDYVQVSFDIMESDPQIGALGGWCEAKFEGERPAWWNDYARYFAVSRQGDESGDISRKKGCLYGAGMVIRKSHWIALNERGFVPQLHCRKGDTLSSGGDTEYSYALRLLGYKMWFDERLYFSHYMTKGRMSLEYLSRLRKAMSASNFIVMPYQEVLLKGMETRNSLIKKALKNLQESGLLHFRKRLFGTYEEKEKAKEFFRLQKQFLLEYNEYRTVRESIDLWLKQ